MQHTPASPALDALLTEAHDPSTPPERLRVLVERTRTHLGLADSDPHPIKDAVAANPNTPVDILVNLASYFPEEFFRNPTAPLILLERPDFIQQMPLLGRLLRCANIPLLFLTTMAAQGNPRLTGEARMHIALAGELPPGEWHHAIRVHWREHIARAPKEELEFYADLTALGIAPDWAAGSRQDIAADLRARLLRASDPSTPADELLRLWGNVHEEAEQDRLFFKKTESHIVLYIALSLNPALMFGAPMYVHTFVQTKLRTTIIQSALQEHLPGGDPQEPETFAFAPTQAEILAVCRRLAWLPGKIAFHPLALFLWPMQAPSFSDELQRCAHSSSWEERLGVACALQPEDHGSAEWLQMLAGDGNRLVRATARARRNGENWEGWL